MHKKECTPAGSHRVVEAVLRWCLEDVSRDLPGLRDPVESQAKCPYVRAVVHAGGVEFDVWHEITRCDAALVDVIAGSAEKFRATGRVSGAACSGCLVSVFPNLLSPEEEVLDAVAWTFRRSFVAAGLLLAPFYPGSARRSVRNAELAVFTAPYPLTVVRALAPHDGIFFQADPVCRAEWEARFRPVADRFPAGGRRPAWTRPRGFQD